MTVRCGKRTPGEQALEPGDIAMWLENLVWGAVAVNACLLVYNYRQVRRWDRLNEMLFQICLSAFAARQGPLAQRMIEIYRREREGTG